ncbi:MAG: AAA family ATPase [Bacteriovoracaceae bacterium]|nr:AAA family ATPase [Bacteriovoracaceae bacterium]
MQKTSDWLMSFSTRPRSNTRPAHPLQRTSSCVKVSVTGGKGGVGKTSVALRMARELGALGHKVLLIDCDTNLSNTAIKLGLPLDDMFWKLLSAEKEFSECVVRRDGYDLLPACNGSIDLFESRLALDEVIIDIVSSHEEEYDWILLDCPAGLDRASLTLNAWCDHRVIVVTPDKSSITDSYSLVKILQTRYGIKENHLLVNMIQNDRQFQKVVMTLSETIENFLGCRTNVLGGIRKVDVSAESFDTFFLSEQGSEWHKNFLKIVQQFAEKWGAGNVSRRPALEQEVH